MARGRNVSLVTNLSLTASNAGYGLNVLHDETFSALPETWYIFGNL